MRNPERIDDFCEELKKLWKSKVPNWRFGQIVCNLQSFRQNDLFYYEEDKFLNTFKEYLNETYGEK